MKLIDISIRRRVTITMFTIGVLLFGMVSLSRLNINLLPELSYPTLTVRTDYEGAAPAEVEQLISRPIEEALGVVKNVEKVRSISRFGQSDITLEFAWGTDMDYASIDVREKLDAIRLPVDAKRPVILRFDPTTDPIMRYAIHAKEDTPSPAGIADRKDSDSDSEARVQEAALNEMPEEYGYDRDARKEPGIQKLKSIRTFADEQLKKELESQAGVASVKVSGGLEEEIQVHIDQQRLAHLNIPIQKVSQVLQAENVNLSGGRLEEGSQQYLVRTINQFQNIGEIGDVIVAHRNNEPVYLHDVARIESSYKEREAITRLNGAQAVEIAIYKEGDANTVTTAGAVKKRLDSFREDMPKNLELTQVYDQSVFISSAIDEVVNAAIIGGILAIIILFIFLRNFWATVIISVSIPVSVIATFNLMYGYDISLNIMSLGGIALGIGLLVDNSIVVLENISRHRNMGKGVLEATREGAGEVGTAVIASTLTTIAVFFPLVFVKGIAGQLFRDQALTVTFALLASLIVALTVIPMLSSLAARKKYKPVPPELKEPRTRVGRWLRGARIFVFTTLPAFVLGIIMNVVKTVTRGLNWLINPLLRGFEKGYGAIEDTYPHVVRWALAHRAMVLIIAVGVFGSSLLLIPRLGVELIPSLSQGEFNVEVELPPGTPIEQTDANIKNIQRRAESLDDIKNVFAVAGTGNRLDANSDRSGENSGELTVKLREGLGRDAESRVMSELRQDLANIPGLEYQFSRPMLFTFNTPIEVVVSGYDLDRIKRVSDELLARMQANGRFNDIESTMEQGHPEVQINFDREKAAALGLEVHAVAERVVQNVRGNVATKFSDHDRKIDIRVRARPEDRSSIHEIRNTIVNPESERPVSLDALASINIVNGPSDIRRIGQQRVAVVNASLNYGDLGTAAEELQGIHDDMKIPPGVEASLSGQNEEMDASFRSLLFALALAVFLVYLVMASQFESLMHPFVILFTIPLALVGAILALWITGSTISVIVFIGLIMLAGIVVNNAIVLIDLINQFRETGMEKFEAIVEAGHSRLRPIVMTTLTTTLGLLPLAIGIGDGSEIRTPMAITVIGGLIVSTLLTLVVIPVVYALLDRKQYDTAATATPDNQ